MDADKLNKNYQRMIEYKMVLEDTANQPKLQKQPGLEGDTVVAMDTSVDPGNGAGEVLVNAAEVTDERLLINPATNQVFRLTPYSNGSGGC